MTMTLSCLAFVVAAGAAGIAAASTAMAHREAG